MDGPLDESQMKVTAGVFSFHLDLHLDNTHSSRYEDFIQCHL